MDTNFKHVLLQGLRCADVLQCPGHDSSNGAAAFHACIADRVCFAMLFAGAVCLLYSPLSTFLLSGMVCSCLCLRLHAVKCFAPLEMFLRCQGCTCRDAAGPCYHRLQGGHLYRRCGPDPTLHRDDSVAHGHFDPQLPGRRST